MLRIDPATLGVELGNAVPRLAAGEDGVEGVERSEAQR
jgi:hypothetical protein